MSSTADQKQTHLKHTDPNARKTIGIEMDLTHTWEKQCQNVVIEKVIQLPNIQ